MAGWNATRCTGRAHARSEGPGPEHASGAQTGPFRSVEDRGLFYSHSMVPGGLLVTSRVTRLTSGTSLVIRVEILASRS